MRLCRVTGLCTCWASCASTTRIFGLRPGGNSNLHFSDSYVNYIRSKFESGCAANLYELLLYGSGIWISSYGFDYTKPDPENQICITGNWSLSPKMKDISSCHKRLWFHNPPCNIFYMFAQAWQVCSSPLDSGALQCAACQNAAMWCIHRAGRDLVYFQVLILTAKFWIVFCSVAEPELVGAEVFWLEPEPILKNY